MRLLCFAPLLIGLAACGEKAEQPAAGGVGADEAAALNNAAEVLDTSPDSLAAPMGNDPEATLDANGAE